MSDIFDTEVGFDKTILNLKECKCIVRFDDRTKCALLYPEETGILKISTQNDIDNIVTMLMGTHYNTIKVPSIYVNPIEDLNFYDLILDTYFPVSGAYRCPDDYSNSNGGLFSGLNPELLQMLGKIFKHLSNCATHNMFHLNDSDYSISNCKIHSQLIDICDDSYNNVEIIADAYHEIGFVNGPNDGVKIKIKQTEFVYDEYFVTPIARILLKCDDWIAGFRTKADLRKSLKKYFPNFVGIIDYKWDASYSKLDKFVFK